jgi:hypothetical protein
MPSARALTADDVNARVESTSRAPRQNCCRLGRAWRPSRTSSVRLVTGARRILLALAVACAAIALVVAFKPFSVSGGTLTDPSGRRFVALTSAESCGAPIVAAWHGKDDVWAVPVGPNMTERGPSFDGLSEIETVRIPTCRSEAQHRLRVAGLWLVASIGLGGFALASRRRFGFGSEPSPA